VYTVQVNFNSLAQYSNTRALAHACCSAQPGHWLGPVAGPGWLGLAQPYGLSWTQPQRNYAGLGPAQSNQKNKKIKSRKIKNVYA